MLCDEGNTYMLYVFIEILDCTQYRKPPVMPVLHISNFWAIGYELGRVVTIRAYSFMFFQL